MTLLPMALFPELNWWQVLLHRSDVQIELCENWVKQSCRSRYRILSPQGTQLLKVPTVKRSRNKLIDVEIVPDKNWAVQHWRALYTAYNKSPFFDHYKSELFDLLHNHPGYLNEFARISIAWCMTKLQLENAIAYTTEYKKVVDEDLRYTELPKEINLRYPQVFEAVTGFQENLSVLDLLFHMGPESGYLLSASV